MPLLERLLLPSILRFITWVVSEIMPIEIFLSTQDLSETTTLLIVPRDVQPEDTCSPVCKLEANASAETPMEDTEEPTTVTSLAQETMDKNAEVAGPTLSGELQHPTRLLLPRLPKRHILRLLEPRLCLRNSRL